MWNRRRWLHTLGILLLILAVSALSRQQSKAPDVAAAAPPPTHDVYDVYELRGFLAISAPAPSVLVSTSSEAGMTDDAKCWGQSQYSDIQQGTVVTVYDDRDEPIANGSLGPGRTQRLELPTSTMPTCWFPIHVADIPTTSTFYQVKVGQRGTIRIENKPEHGVLRAFPTLDPTDGPAPTKAGHPGVEEPPDPQIPSVPSLDTGAHR
jgi:hypothetical protein